MSLHVGDTAPALSGKLGANLSGAQAVAHLRKPDGKTLSKPVTLGTFADGSTPWTAEAWAAGEVDQDGNWEVEVEVTFSDGSIQTSDVEVLTVEAQIA